MLQIGHLDPLKVAFNSGGAGMYPMYTDPIGHMVLMYKPNET